LPRGTVLDTSVVARAKRCAGWALAPAGGRVEDPAPTTDVSDAGVVAHHRVGWALATARARVEHLSGGRVAAGDAPAVAQHHATRALALAGGGVEHLSFNAGVGDTSVIT